MCMLICGSVVQETFCQQNHVGLGAAGWQHGSVPSDMTQGETSLI